MSFFPKEFIIGADLVTGSLSGAASRNPGVRLLVLDLQRCPLPDQCVDVVVMLNVLEHCEDDIAALEHCLRILKPGGVAILEVPAGPGLFDAYDAELKHFRRYSAEDLERRLTQVGFSSVITGYWGSLAYPLFWFVKKINKVVYKHAQGGVVRRNLLMSRKSIALSTLLWAERKIVPKGKLRFGIRVTAVAKRL